MKRFLFFLICALYALSPTTSIDAQAGIACGDHINVTVSGVPADSCGFTVGTGGTNFLGCATGSAVFIRPNGGTGYMIAAGGPYTVGGKTYYKWPVSGDGLPVPTRNYVIPANLVGATGGPTWADLNFIGVTPIHLKSLIGAERRHIYECATGTTVPFNRCWGTFSLEDKYPPSITCNPTITVQCDSVGLYLNPSMATAPNRPVKSDNCGFTSDSSLVIHDFTKDCGGFIMRKWAYTDCGGTIVACADTIYITPMLRSRIFCPTPIVELTCGVDNSPAGVNGFTKRVQDAWPYYVDGAGTPRSLVGVCAFKLFYEDVTLDVCEPGCKGNQKVIRNWTVLDWCNGSIFYCTQIIKSVDTEGPTFIVKDETVSTNPWNCTADFWMPEVWELHDNCDLHPDYVVKADTILPDLKVTWVEGKGWRASGVPCGEVRFKYIASDCCGNETIGYMTVKVMDRTAPVPIAIQDIVLGLTPGFDAHGTADAVGKLYAESVNNGSHDNCSDVRIEIKRVDTAPSCSNVGYYGHNNNRTYSSMPGITCGATSTGINTTWTWTVSGAPVVRDAGVSPTNANWKVVLINEEAGLWTWKNCADPTAAPIVREQFKNYTGGGTVTQANITRADATTVHNFLDTDGGKFVKFCCEDIPAGQSYAIHEVHMRVWDDGNKDGCIGCWVLPTADNPNPQQDNYNDTWANVRVENNNPPILLCPKDATIYCDWPIETSVGVWKSIVGSDFSKTGVATAQSACGNPAIEFSDKEFVNKCDVGYILRTFRVPFTPKNSTTTSYVTCVQRIDILPSNSQVVWNFNADTRYYHTFIPKLNPYQQVEKNAPISHTVVTCDGPTAADIAKWEPTYVQGPCDVIGVSTSTERFDFEDGVCRKWITTYKFVNWCNHYEVSYYKTWVFEDTQAPVIACQDTCIAAGANCKTSVTLTKSATDDGGCIPDDPNRWLKWYAVVDLWADGSIDYAWSTFVPTNYNFGSGHLLQVAPGLTVPAKYLAPTKPGQNAPITFPGLIEGKHSFHKVTWKVTDGCHNFSSCTEIVEVKDKKAPTPYCINLSTALMAVPAGAPAGTLPMVELWAKDFDKGSFDGDLVWPCTLQKDLLFTFDGARPVDVSYEHYFKGNGEAATAAEYAAGAAQKWLPSARSSAKIWTSASLSGASHTTVDVKMSVWDWFFNTDFCWVQLKLVCNGNGCPTGGTGSRIAGTVSTESNQTVNNVTVTIDANITEYPVSVTTPTSGVYERSVPSGIDYEVTASKGGDYLNGVSTLDLVMIQRHILGIEALASPYKLIAADINHDNKVTASDLTELRKLILGIYNELPSNTSWRFPISSQSMNATSPFPYLEKIAISAIDKDMVNQNFVAVKVGDVNGNVSTNVSNPAVESRSNNTVAMAVAEQNITAGNVVEIPVTAANFNDVLGFQYTMNLKGASLVGIHAGALDIDNDNIGILANDVVTMSYASDKAITVANDEVLFTLVVKADNATKVSEMLSIGSSVTPAEAYSSDFTVAKVSLEVRTAPVTAIELMQNEPNPFKGQTTVSFMMPEAAAATLSVYDVTGKAISVRNISAHKGLNSEVFTREQLGASGVMYYTLKSGDFTATKKMIIIE